MKKIFVFLVLGMFFISCASASINFKQNDEIFWSMDNNSVDYGNLEVQGMIKTEELNVTSGNTIYLNWMNMHNNPPYTYMSGDLIVHNDDEHTTSIGVHSHNEFANGIAELVLEAGSDNLKSALNLIKNSPNSSVYPNYAAMINDGSYSTMVKHSDSIGWGHYENFTVDNVSGEIGNMTGIDMHMRLTNESLSLYDIDFIVNGSVDVNDGTVTISTGQLRAYGAGGVTTNFVAGSGAGADMTTSSGTTLVGSNAGQDLTTGTSNTLIGYNAGKDLINRNFNTYIGQNAGSAVNDSNRVTGIGVQTFVGATGISYSTGLGMYAGYNSSGIGGTYLGYNAGHSETENGKLHISNYYGTLIEGSFTNDWLNIYGDLDVNRSIDITGNATIGGDLSLPLDSQKVWTGEQFMMQGWISQQKPNYVFTIDNQGGDMYLEAYSPGGDVILYSDESRVITTSVGVNIISTDTIEIDSQGISASIDMILGTNTDATSFNIKNNAENNIFTVGGSGDVTLDTILPKNTNVNIGESNWAGRLVIAPYGENHSGGAIMFEGAKNPGNPDYEDFHVDNFWGYMRIYSSSSSDKYITMQNGGDGDIKLGINVEGIEPQSILDVNGTIRARDLIKLDAITLPTCDGTTSGSIGRNSTKLYFCDGSLWNGLY
jgi:hypothetical protein